MQLRGVSERDLVDVIETGIVKPKTKNKAWVFKSFAQRNDNLVAASVVVEAVDLVVITVMVNWEPI
jgi:hypothetical protein